MIIVFTPYCPNNEGKIPEPGMDLGYANNECMRRLLPKDWGFFLEHDLSPTTPNWYRHLEFAVKSKPEAGFFTAMRWTGPPGWCVPNFKEVPLKQLLSWNFHRKYGQKLEDECWGKLQDITEYEKLPGGNASAGIFLVSKSVWEEVGKFKNGFKSEHIDYDFHRRVRSAGYRGYLISGLYFYHQKGALGVTRKSKKVIQGLL
jgi:GT2 family glycosyltransferase